MMMTLLLTLLCTAATAVTILAEPINTTSKSNETSFFEVAAATAKQNRSTASTRSGTTPNPGPSPSPGPAPSPSPGPAPGPAPVQSTGPAPTPGNLGNSPSPGPPQNGDWNDANQQNGGGGSSSNSAIDYDNAQSYNTSGAQSVDDMSYNPFADYDTETVGNQEGGAVGRRRYWNPDDMTGIPDIPLGRNRRHPVLDPFHNETGEHYKDHKHHVHKGLNGYDGEVAVPHASRNVNAMGNLNDGWPPKTEWQCQDLLGESYLGFKERISWWTDILFQRAENKIWTPTFHKCCGITFPFNSGVSFSYAGGGCPAFMVNANYMQVATWYLPGAEVLSTVSAGTWYSAVDHYGNKRWPEGRGTRVYGTGRWTDLPSEALLEGINLGLDALCIGDDMNRFLSEGILKVMVDKNYWIYQMWEDAIWNGFLRPVGIPVDLEYGQAVSQYEWVQEFCADWSPVTTIMKRDGQTMTPFVYGMWPFFRRRYESIFQFGTAVWEDPFDDYQHLPFKYVVAASSSFFGGIVGLSHKMWEVLCYKFPGVPACHSNQNIPPAWFDDEFNTLLLPIDLNVQVIWDSGKAPFKLSQKQVGIGWDCPYEPDTVLGRFQKSIHPAYTPCVHSDGGVADNSGFIANVVTREWITMNSPLRRFYAQNKILTVQAMPDMSMVPMMCGFSVEKMRRELPHDKEHGLALITSYMPGMNMGGPYGQPTFKPYMQFDPYLAVHDLIETGISLWPAAVLQNEDLGTNGNYSLLLSFSATVKTQKSNSWLLTYMPPKYFKAAKKFGFPEMPVQFKYPEPVVKAISTFVEYEALKHIYHQRWSGYCWTWLDYMSHETWFADAVCYCFQAPFYRTREAHASWAVPNAALIEDPNFPLVSYFTQNVKHIAEGYYGSPHFYDPEGGIRSVLDFASFMLTHEVVDYMHEAASIGSIAADTPTSAHWANRLLPPFWNNPGHICTMSNIEHFHNLKVQVAQHKKGLYGSFIPDTEDAMWRWGQTWTDYDDVMGIMQQPYDSHGGMWGYGIRGTTDYANSMPDVTQNVMDTLGHLNGNVNALNLGGHGYG